MSFPSGQSEDERLLVLKCQQGDPDALVGLRERHHRPLIGILLARGASPTEAEDILADLWSDCVPGADDRTPLIEKFSGKCGLLGWLATVATHRWLDGRRKQVRHVQFSPSGPDDPREGPLDRLPAPTPASPDHALIELLRESLQAAFARCPAEEMVLLRLRFLHGVSQRELARMLGCHETRISRAFGRAMAQIEADTLQAIKEREPKLELTWQDLLEVCQTEQIGFL